MILVEAGSFSKCGLFGLEDVLKKKISMYSTQNKMSKSCIWQECEFYCFEWEIMNYVEIGK